MDDSSLYRYRATLVKVVDADTIDVMIDCGFGIFHKLRLRLHGIDAPERHTDEGKAATEFVRLRLENYKDRLIVETFKDKKGKFGRYLARIYITDQLDSLNEMLLKAGHAEEY